MTSSIPRPEHPRPDFERESFYNLNGVWGFAFDDRNLGQKERWEQPGRKLDREILVPFPYQSKLSGIGGDEIHEVLWYRRPFTLPDAMLGQRVWLRFGAVDFYCQVFINGRAAGMHQGGYAPFGFDISPFLTDGENDLCLRVVDKPDRSQPRGKQYWERGLMGCWYTPVSGIWQTVYLEATGQNCFESVHVTPDIDRCEARVDVQLAEKPLEPLMVSLLVNLDGKKAQAASFEMKEKRASLTIDMRVPGVDSLKLWSPNHPALYELEAALQDAGGELDKVRMWFGMRHVEVKNGQVLLNHQPIYQRLVLDQGYWPESLLTPPSDEAIRRDVQWIKDLGFNGVRKHQKMEDPRFYHWCDRMGLLVWGELPSPYEYNQDMLGNVMDSMLDFIRRDFNHPSIITWVPLNESWGVREVYADPRQQAAARMLTQLCRAADGTRLISANDGWEQTETDICALHDYAADSVTIKKHFSNREQVEKTGCDWRLAYARGVEPTGEEAFLITEYGGIAIQSKGEQGVMGGMATWGYHDKVEDEEAFLKRYEDVTSAVRAIPYCQGYCYTQLTDVMQEINGLLTPQREPKADVQRIRQINRNPDGING